MVHYAWVVNEIVLLFSTVVIINSLITPRRPSEAVLWSRGRSETLRLWAHSFASQRQRSAAARLSPDGVS